MIYVISDDNDGIFPLLLYIIIQYSKKPLLPAQELRKSVITVTESVRC